MDSVSRVELNQEMLSGLWQIVKAIVQCTMKKSCCKPIPLPSVAGLVFLCVCFVLFWGFFLFFSEMYIWHGYFFVCVCEMTV